MLTRRLSSLLYRGGGIILGAAGIAIIIKTVPFIFWSIIAGLFLIWLGWRVFCVERF